MVFHKDQTMEDLGKDETIQVKAHESYVKLKKPSTSNQAKEVPQDDEEQEDGVPIPISIDDG